MPSDELHPKSTPVTFKDFEGVSISDALKFQKVMRARSGSLENLGAKEKAIAGELITIDLALSVYITEEIRKQEG
jgi:hypothetical protein